MTEMVAHLNASLKQDLFVKVEQQLLLMFAMKYVEMAKTLENYNVKMEILTITMVVLHYVILNLGMSALEVLQIISILAHQYAEMAT